jgi:type II restriction enzyme
MELAGKITGGLSANRIVIVCVDNEKVPISLLLEQLGVEDKIQAIITRSDLEEWYERALRGKYAPLLGDTLIECLRTEFRNEFPYTGNFTDFWNSRGYGQMGAVDSPFWFD